MIVIISAMAIISIVTVIYLEMLNFFSTNLDMPSPGSISSLFHFAAYMNIKKISGFEWIRRIWYSTLICCLLSGMFWKAVCLKEVQFSFETRLPQWLITLLKEISLKLQRWQWNAWEALAFFFSGGRWAAGYVFPTALLYSLLTFLSPRKGLKNPASWNQWGVYY